MTVSMNELSKLYSDLSYHQFSTIYDTQNLQQHISEIANIKKKMSSVQQNANIIEDFKKSKNAQEQADSMFSILFNTKQIQNAVQIFPMQEPEFKVPSIPTIPKRSEKKQRKRKQTGGRETEHSIDKLSAIVDLPY